MENYKNITLENIEAEHLCCAIGDPKHQKGIETKKDWLKKQIPEGHVFRKLDARGKVFIEYSPLEKAWVPVEGKDFLYIYCLWVAGSFKGAGHGDALLKYAIEEAKKQNKNGLCTLSSKKKKPYLSEKKFFLKYGFRVVDQIGDYELLALTFHEEEPKISESAKKMEIEDDALTIFYSPQCPYVKNGIKEIEEYQTENQVDIHFECIDTLEKAKQVPCIFNNYAIFQNKKYVSNAILNKNMVAKFFVTE